MNNRSPWFWLFLTPVILGLGIVVVIPFIYGFIFSFTDWNGLTATQFTGLKNYIQLFHEDEFMHSIWFTVKFAFVTVILLNILGLLLALLVTRNIKSNHMLRTVFFMPNLIGGLILGFIWQFVFVNVFNNIGDILGIEALQGWLSTTTTGFWGLVIPNCLADGWLHYDYLHCLFRKYSERID